MVYLRSISQNNVAPLPVSGFIEMIYLHPTKTCMTSAAVPGDE